MDDLHTDTSADAPAPAGEASPASRPAHLVDSADADMGGEGEPRRRRRWLLPTLLAPLALVVVLVIAWAVDTSSQEVARNVRLTDVEIGGLTKDELAGRVAEVAADFTTTPVELAVGDKTYATTAGDIGLMVDQDETAAAALKARTSTFLPARPLDWVLSFFSHAHAPLRLEVSAEQVATTVVALEGDDHTPPTEPTVELVDGAFSVVPGTDGVGLDPAEVASRLPAAADAAMADGDGVIRLTLDTGPIPPLGSEDAARQAASDAEALVSEPLSVRTPGGDRSVSPDLLRRWVRLDSNPDGTVAVTLDNEAVAAGLRYVFGDIEGHPVDASFTLEDGVPVIRPDQPGTVCCAEGSAALVLEALHRADRAVDLELAQGQAGFTTTDAEAYGIKEPVGGSNAWRSGAPTTGPPGFTTWVPGPANRIANIHRIADIVRGVVVAPGASFSINDYVGQRTVAKGFVEAGAIRDGEHVSEVGGGVSQFATTTFNAAYFAGLQIDESQAHSEWFDRYPRGREATMGYPEPDLAFTNDTPYGIMIWTSYTDETLTVTLYSTPYARGEQTGITESQSGTCTVVTTTRTITYPDGKTATDQFRATYRRSGTTTC